MCVCVCVCVRARLRMRRRRRAQTLKTAQMRVLELATASCVVLETGDLFADNLA